MSNSIIDSTFIINLTIEWFRYPLLSLLSRLTSDISSKRDLVDEDGTNHNMQPIIISLPTSMILIKLYYHDHPSLL